MVTDRDEGRATIQHLAWILLTEKVNMTHREKEPLRITNEIWSTRGKRWNETSHVKERVSSLIVSLLACPAWMHMRMIRRNVFLQIGAVPDTR